MGTNFAGRAFLLGWLFCSSMVVPEVGGEESLIEKLCDQTKGDFLFCMDCLKGKSPTAEIDDLIKLGAKAIDCAYRTSKLALSAMIDYSKNSSGDIQEMAQYCVPRLDDQVTLFDEAVGFWSYLKKSMAIESIMSANEVFHDCTGRLPDDSPPDLNVLLNCDRARIDVSYFVISAIPVV